MGIMKKIHTFFLAVFLCFFLGGGEVKAQNAKARALGSMALYGTIGGSLLGTATLAFGNSARAIAQGASLGLYAGLIFGSYVVLSHGLVMDLLIVKIKHIVKKKKHLKEMHVCQE